MVSGVRFQVCPDFVLRVAGYGVNIRPIRNPKSEIESILYQPVRSDIVDIFIVIKGNHQINPLQIICDLT